MHPLLVVQFLVLLIAANGTPVIAKKMLPGFLATPMDGHYVFFDGRAVFGSSKTIRGVLLAVSITFVLSPLIGLPWFVGGIVGTTAMAGDLFSSFIKRRIKLAPSAMALGLDQIPECLFPMFACKPLIDLTIIDIAVVVGAFVTCELVVSPLLFKLKIRDRPF
jgi:CDP-diglyceride synthetase